MNSQRSQRPPELILDLPAERSEIAGNRSDVGFTVINYNTAARTLRCVISLSECIEAPSWILVLDNASSKSDFEFLKEGLASVAFSRIQLFRSETNLGFAAGSNFLIGQLLGHDECQHIGLLNNDAVATRQLAHLLLAPLLNATHAVGMSGGRMHKLSNPEEIDTLGIALYASLIPADRKCTDDPYLGPTGGCCLMTRTFVEDVKTVSGYCFDERFFCYCEDTDLALRANLLGYKPAYVDQLVALHEGQASSRTQQSTFIAYHGLRNAIWMHWKLVPTSILLSNIPWLLLVHILTVLRHTLAGRLRLLISIYRDSFQQLPAMLHERAHFQRVSRIDTPTLRKAISRRFYRKGYFREVLVKWWRQLPMISAH